MIGLEDRRALARDIDVAHTAGARLKPSCETAGIDLRTLQRWQAADGLVSGDGRPQAVRATPARVKVVVASFMRPTVEYGEHPNASSRWSRVLG